MSLSRYELAAITHGMSFKDLFIANRRRACIEASRRPLPSPTDIDLFPTGETADAHT